MPDPLPQTIRALELSNYSGLDALSVVEKPLPELKENQVLVKVSAAAVNPSDLMFMRELYGFTKDLPVVPGFEASGRVVAGEGAYGRWLVGKRVACGVQATGDGTWAEYVAVGTTMCMPLLGGVSDEQGAMLLVNPFTAWALLEKARRGHKAAVHTAAASALGRMLLKLAQKTNFPVIHIVRREAQVELLKNLGAKHVLDSSTDTFDEDLADLSRKLGATLALDAVAGELPQRLLANMPRGSVAAVYGGLSEKAVEVNPLELIFERKRVEGFWLSDYLDRLSLPGLLYRAWRVQRALIGDLRIDVRGRYTLDEAVEGIKTYEQRMTDGKILIVP